MYFNWARVGGRSKIFYTSFRFSFACLLSRHLNTQFHHSTLQIIAKNKAKGFKKKKLCSVEWMEIFIIRSVYECFHHHTISYRLPQATHSDERKFFNIEMHLHVHSILIIEIAALTINLTSIEHEKMRCGKTKWVLMMKSEGRNRIFFHSLYHSSVAALRGSEGWQIEYKMHFSMFFSFQFLTLFVLHHVRSLVEVKIGFFCHSSHFHIFLLILLFLRAAKFVVDLRMRMIREDGLIKNEKEKEEW